MFRVIPNNRNAFDKRLLTRRTASVADNQLCTFRDQLPGKVLRAVDICREGRGNRRTSRGDDDRCPHGRERLDNARDQCGVARTAHGDVD